MDEAVAGRYTEDRRMMLDVAIWRGGRVIYQDSALNDVTVANGNMQRTVEVEAAADDIPAFLFRGDGVIVSTPTGSTALFFGGGRTHRRANRGQHRGDPHLRAHAADQALRLFGRAGGFRPGGQLKRRPGLRLSGWQGERGVPAGRPHRHAPVSI